MSKTHKDWKYSDCIKVQLWAVKKKSEKWPFFSSKILKNCNHIIIAALTFNKDIVGMIFWNQSIWLYAVTLLLPVLFIELWSAAGAPLAHLCLHTQQTLVQLVSLQQAGQLVLGKVSWPLRVSEEESVLKRRLARVWVWMSANSTSGGLWYMVRRLLENSFMSLSISCFISGGRLANSSELMSIEFGSW